MITSRDLKLNKNKCKQDKIIKMITTHGNKNLKDISNVKVAINNTWSRIEDLGRFTKDQKILIGNHDWVKDYWKDEPAYIIGASNAIEGFDLSLLDGKHTIGINHMIEKYDNFEFFIFLDQRFLKLTTYNMNNFSGTVFYSNQNKKLNNKNQVVFKSMSMKQNSNIQLNMDNGLFNGSMTGLCALHLALITGANPIYLLGCDTSKSVQDGNFHVSNYTGDTKKPDRLKKYVGACNYYKSFERYKNRIINVVDDSKMEHFKQMPITKLTKQLELEKKKLKDKTICHVIVMENMQKMGDISRQIYDLSDGKHIYCNIQDVNTKLPQADIYLLECFINQSQKFIDFKKPKNSKVISLIHSSSRCMPAKCSDKIITITDAWKDKMKMMGHESTMIHAGIDTDIYKYQVDYNNLNFGRISRYSLGKVHKDTQKIYKNTLNKIKDSKCYFYGDKFPDFSHERFFLDKSIKINEHDKKAQALSKLSVFADIHGTFVETFSLCLLEAMAAGLCIILYSSAPQPAMLEVLGNTGIVCKSLSEYEKTLLEILPDAKTKKHYGQLAKKRAQEFTIEKMTKKYNEVFRAL